MRGMTGNALVGDTEILGVQLGAAENIFGTVNFIAAAMDRRDSELSFR